MLTDIHCASHTLYSVRDASVLSTPTLTRRELVPTDLLRCAGKDPGPTPGQPARQALQQCADGTWWSAGSEQGLGGSPLSGRLSGQLHQSIAKCAGQDKLADSATWQYWQFWIQPVSSSQSTSSCSTGSQLTG